MHKEPTLESFVDFSPRNTFLDPQEGRRFEKILKHEDKVEHKKNLTRWQKVRKALAITAAIMTPIAGANAVDVYQNYEFAAHADVGINYMAPPLDSANNDTALFFFNGFNSYDAAPIIQTIGPAVQQGIDGQLVDVVYANAHLGADTYPGKSNQIGIDNVNGIADQIREYSDKHDIKNVVIVTYSMGCVPGTMTGENLTKDPETSTLVKAFIYISCPSDFDALRNKTQNEVDFVKAVSPIPGAAYSTPIRLGGELYFLIQQYEGGDLIRAIRHGDSLIKNAVADVQRQKATGTWTIFDQALLIDQANFKTRFQSIADNTSDSLTPLDVYVGTGKGGYDNVVNDKQSAKDITHDAQAAHLPYLTYQVPNAVHAEPEMSKKEYRQTFTAAKVAIQQALGLQEEIYNVKQMRALSQYPILRPQK
ncbi:hypothetical protein EPN95_01405 [Patescibacteria group bacterium]|nr:MAG: hypothetical protein EPN95_01405 [Patescibacteria group bacterium]